MKDVKLKNLRTGREFFIDKETTLIGRDTECDVVLALGYPSRNHAKLLINGDQLILEDLKSTNGTFVNEQRIDAPTPLQNGDVVKFGTEEYSLEGVSETDNKAKTGRLLSGDKKSSRKRGPDDTMIMR